MVLISEPHGSWDGLHAGRLITQKIPGKKRTKYLIVEAPDDRNKSTESFREYLKQIHSNDLEGGTYLRDRMDSMVDTAIGNEWEVRGADSTRLMKQHGANAVARQEYIAANIKKYFRRSEGLVAVYGTAHIKGSQFYQSLTHILTGGHTHMDEPLIQSFKVDMGDNGNSAKKIQIVTIPRNLLYRMMNVGGAK